MKIKIKIREIRENKNMGLLELAQKANISKSHLSDIERGIKEPTLSVLVKIASALEVDESELYEVED